MGFELTSLILSLKSRTTLILCPFLLAKFLGTYLDLLTNLCQSSLSTLKGLIPTRKVFWSSCRFSLNRSGMDLLNPCPTLYCLINTILSTLGLRNLSA
ncbi:hypothetical protein IGI04_012146 [Brassica rapa subsp. trilocularis]|uniref:Uncharacterized protein n=1 Tax=Brassica rapa subsp. trilocularis TaxID=1813537 RepID=A0ABQ7N558_BRACM|nr:hypothetical protein IGI04_012146 [Brassica rapa subsp. trilocularis]